MTVFPDRLLILVLLFWLWIKLSHAQRTCNDTFGWNNNHSISCSYSPSWCPNETYTPQTYWMGGSLYNYPEFNCCGCGKGWPLWFAPLVGFTATKAIPEVLGNAGNNPSTSNLQCVDTYGNSSTCAMKCKSLTSPVTLIETITESNFDSFNCTLHLQATNGSLLYALRIPQDNFLIYFTNWTTNEYQFSCSNNMALPNSNMLCRRDFVQCLSTTVTNRYVPPNCINTPGWRNNHTGSTDGKGWTCFEYEIIYRWCAGGTFTAGNQWTLGVRFNFPEFNCCVCGKGSLPPYQLIPSSGIPVPLVLPNVGIIHLQNCSNPGRPAFVFDLKCLGPLNFTTTNTTTSAVLFNCPLNCFADWYIRVDNNTATLNVTRQYVGLFIVYHLSSDLFPVYTSQCSAVVGENLSSTTLSLYPNPVTTLEPYPASQSTEELTLTSTTVTYYSPTSQSLAWQPPSCANGNIGPACNISADACQMANPCINDGICINVYSSSYVCTCIKGFTGRNCEIDMRPCQPFTCMRYSQCIETNLTTFRCDCEPGYEGFHCESLINYCLDVTCHNDAQCRPILLNFTCECTTNDFTGRYCEIKSSSLASKQTINRGLGYIAMLALASVAITIVLMDVMKYVFNIDPVEEERKQVADRRRQQRFVKSKPQVVQRFVYVNT